ncbi:ADP-ribosylation factor-like 6 interacting protein [Bombyx mori]|uniref:ADP-ribosylation factor-like 6 interacting protein isoform 1 n=1 Tax=Bombyx mori TaxID=7091 RepID=Q1HQA2_BOMMO|nr:ADP-ribosylation factor-like 6 interacting protein [Bombyx mori]ABF51239.1 ADP-ribosylation factor-like 6 interacting protein isoform 1 [Bombyx mori]
MGEKSSTVQDQEQQVRKVKRTLEGWRVALLSLKSVILWEQQWHPCAIVGSMTIMYLLIWLLDLNTLASIAIVGLILNFVDFMVPVICNQLYGSSSWTGQHEKTFEEICRSIVISYNKLVIYIHSFYSLRDTSPFMYYTISISTLCTVAWISSSINNIFLLYLLSTVVLLWPGIQRSGIFNSFFSVVNMAPKIPFLKSE